MIFGLGCWKALLVCGCMRTRGKGACVFRGLGESGFRRGLLTLRTAHPIPTPVLINAEGATKNAAPDATLASSDPPSVAAIPPYEHPSYQDIILWYGCEVRTMTAYLA
jgi:hypothetical protein